MSVSAAAIDLMSGRGSFGISSIIMGTFKLIFKHLDNVKEERATFYKHALDINTRETEDIQKARAYGDDGVRWTRRILSLIPNMYVFLGFLMVGMMYTFGYPTLVSMPVSVTHHFLLFSWTTTTVIKMQGMIYFPWMAQLLFTFSGFYFGAKVVSQ